MARRCGCASGSCSCVVRGGDGVTVSGSGSSGDPYIIDAADVPLTGKLQVIDTDTVNLTLNGQGTLADPYVLTADATLALGDLTDVDDTDTTPGYVVGRRPDGTFGMFPPSTAPVGAVVHDATLEGDGSAGNPLSVHDYENIAFLDGADPANLPNNASFGLGALTDPNPYQYRVQRQAPAGYPHTNAELRMGLIQTGTVNGTVFGVSLDRDGVNVGHMAMFPQGHILTRAADGEPYHPLPFRTFARDFVVNGAAGFATLAVVFPAGRFTQPPVVTLTAVNGGTAPILVYTQARSATGCNIRMGRADGVSMVGQQFTVSLHAIQLEP